jgi:hypothetical protein
MESRLKRMWSALNLEERILNGAAIVCFISIFLPWLSGELPNDDKILYTGFDYYTSFIGITVFIFLVAILLLTLIPLFGGPIVFRKKHRENVRFFLSIQCTVLLLAALSVLVKVGYGYTRIEISYGIYMAIIGSIIMTIYTFLRWQEEKKSETHDLFHHPEDGRPHSGKVESTIPTPPPPPPPPPLEPEELHIRAKT